MKCVGDNAPSAFTIEEQPKNPGFILARFFENIRPYTETHGEQIISGYQYDEYHLELPDSVTSTDIANSLSAYLSAAKAKEDNTEAALRARVNNLIQENRALLTQVSSLESQLTDTQLALCDVYEIVYGGI